MKKIYLLLSLLLLPLTTFAYSSFTNFQQFFDNKIYYFLILGIFFSFVYLVCINIILKQTKIKSIYFYFLIIRFVCVLLEILLFDDFNNAFFYFELFVMCSLVNIAAVLDTVSNFKSSSYNETKCPICGEKIHLKDIYCVKCGFCNKLLVKNKYKVDGEIILKEIDKMEFNKEINEKIPLRLYRRNVLNYTLISILLFIFISSLFLRLDYKIILIIFIILAVYSSVTVLLSYAKKKNINKYIYKCLDNKNNSLYDQLNEIKNSYVKNNCKKYLVLGLLLAIISSFIIFYKPRMIFVEDNHGNVFLLYYVLGINKEEKVVIPDTYNGKKVTNISEGAFEGVRSIKELTISDNITVIEKNAFRNCSNLTNLVFSKNSNIRAISPSSITGTAIKEIYLPKDIMELEEVPEGIEVITYNNEYFYKCAKIAHFLIAFFK